MRLAFSTIACPDYGVEQMAAAVAEHGYDGLELYAYAGATLTPARLAAELGRFRRGLRGTPLACLNSFASLSDGDPAQEAQVLQAMRLAHVLLCPLVKVFGGEVGADRAGATARVAAALERLAHSAVTLGVTVVVETHDGFCRGRDLAAALPATAAGAAALWDVHHPVRHGEAPAATDAAIGARTAHVHVKDAVRDGDGWRLVPLGEGDLPVAEVLGLLRRRGYDGYLSVDHEKLWHPELAGPEQALPQHAEALRRLLATP